MAHDIGSAVTTDSTAARPFVGGKIELASADVSGDHYVDHEKEVLAYSIGGHRQRGRR